MVLVMKISTKLDYQAILITLVSHHKDKMLSMLMMMEMIHLIKMKRIMKM